MAKPANPNVNPFNVYMNAERYRVAYRLLYTEGEKNPQLMATIAAPHIVLSAFACELYFKCLLCLEAGKIPPTHNLKDLFRKLSVLSRNRIQQIWDEYARAPRVREMWDMMERVTGKKVPRDFATQLDMSAMGFVEMRYTHEDDSTSFLIGDLPEMLRMVILERRPLWATLRHAPPTSRPRETPAPDAKSA